MSFTHFVSNLQHWRGRNEQIMIFVVLNFRTSIFQLVRVHELGRQVQLQLEIIKHFNQTTTIGYVERYNPS